MSTYLVMAIRWGNLNGNWYFVYAGSDETKAHALARAENADRGGKYGCAVFLFDEDGTNYRIVAYHPSSMEEDDAKEPRHNHRRDFFERLGSFLNDAASGKALLPSLTDHRTLTYQPIECPQAMKDEVERQRKVYEAMAKMEEKPMT